jgi:hypothetical protein
MSNPVRDKLIREFDIVQLTVAQARVGRYYNLAFMKLALTIESELPNCDSRREALRLLLQAHLNVRHVLAIHWKERSYEKKKQDAQSVSGSDAESGLGSKSGSGDADEG